MQILRNSLGFAASPGEVLPDATAKADFEKLGIQAVQQSPKDPSQNRKSGASSQTLDTHNAAREYLCMKKPEVG